MTHPLTHYRKSNAIRSSDMALKIGISRQSLNRIERGEQTPSLDLAYRIETITNKAVTASQLAAFSSEAVLND